MIPDFYLTVPQPINRRAEERLYQAEHHAEEWLEEQNFGTGDKGYFAMMSLSLVPAAGCKEGCEVEPDGRCKHGHHSVLFYLGLV